MEFRFGIDRGEVVKKEGTIFGDGVNIAVRIQSFADAGGICVSGAVYEQIKDTSELRFDYLGKQSVQNIKDPVRIYRVLREGETVSFVQRLTTVRIKLLETVFYCHYHYCGVGWFGQRSLATLPETVPADC